MRCCVQWVVVMLKKKMLKREMQTDHGDSCRQEAWALVSRVVKKQQRATGRF